MSGETLTSSDSITKEAVTFYKNFLGNSDTEVIGCSMNLLKEFVTPLSDEDALSLCVSITDEEIKKSLFGIRNDKAPGPNCFTSKFFKDSWSLVKSDEFEDVKQFFISCSLLPAFNYTSLTLIPKKKIPQTMFDFRPIACCSVIYKCITKILANRLKSYLSDIISRNQSAFVEGRNISDNVLLAQELVKGYGRSLFPQDVP